jgi:hypothetical protein
MDITTCNPLIVNRILVWTYRLHLCSWMHATTLTYGQSFHLFEAFIAVVMKSSIFLAVTPCNPLIVNRLLVGSCHLHFHKWMHTDTRTYVHSFHLSYLRISSRWLLGVLFSCITPSNPLTVNRLLVGACRLHFHSWRISWARIQHDSNWQARQSLHAGWFPTDSLASNLRTESSSRHPYVQNTAHPNVKQRNFHVIILWFLVMLLSLLFLPFLLSFRVAVRCRVFWTSPRNFSRFNTVVKIFVRTILWWLQ